MADKTVKLAFDPERTEAPLRECFRHVAARTMWLLWRPSHIVSDTFATACLDIGRRIDAKQPKTPEELKWCIQPSIGFHHDFAEADVIRFCEEFLPFFQGLRTVDFQIG